MTTHYPFYCKYLLTVSDRYSILYITSGGTEDERDTMKIELIFIILFTSSIWASVATANDEHWPADCYDIVQGETVRIPTDSCFDAWEKACKAAGECKEVK